MQYSSNFTDITNSIWYSKKRI